MEVILQENVSSLGFVGDVVKVKPGYARNFLLPKKLAVVADRKSKAQFEHLQKLIEVKKAQKQKDALELKKRLEAVKLTIVHATADGEKLFGSVTSVEVQGKLVENGFDLDRKLIRIETPIRTVGEHEVEIKLHQEVSAVLKITVEGKTA